MVKIGPMERENMETVWDEKRKDRNAKIFATSVSTQVLFMHFNSSLFDEIVSFVMSNRHGPD